MALSAGLTESYMKLFELPKEEVLEQKAAFDVLDIDKSDSITFQELKAMNSKFSTGFTDKELEEQFKELDVDGNGKVLFPEFLKVYVKGQYGRDVALHLVQGDHYPEDLAPGTLSRTPTRTRRPTLTPVAESEAGVADMKISKKNSARFYSRAAEKFFEGSEERPAVELLRIRALGEAIAIAVAVATKLEKDGLGCIKTLSTAYPAMDGGGNSASIAIDVSRVVPKA
mmetsp:Transcript_21938/g.51302  ORF Transcript_21938/g.51302 Transcript_21938/m.51302 type:complete len:227 (+) Transcript_21938:102-782(+)|eukprot:CAMPEP_0178417644 /NCGR_PEP_ID=MMETSP0689_2-20121128/24677_1 /TAXON_ID=160604 /ORGANISM="Amphidinium massartii, Strain CS-259" /LENGTH=226 /DNA_ID=CAMNT_0020039009 /DNA_START=91 /DNA_END=771 /DNA_ORIENTATION=+